MTLKRLTIGDIETIKKLMLDIFSGEPWNAPRADSSAVLDLTAAAGRCLPQLAADDSHFYTGEACRAYTMLQAGSLTPEGVIAALKRGEFYASQGPEFLDAELAGGELIVRTSPAVSYTHLSTPTQGNPGIRSWSTARQASSVRRTNSTSRCV